jgi:hypothetical protein
MFQNTEVSNLTRPVPSSLHRIYSTLLLTHLTLDFAQCVFHPELVVLLSNIVFELNPQAPAAVRDAVKLICSYAMKETHTPQNRLLHDVAPLRHVKTVQELSDILVADFADLLDVGRALGNVLEALSSC